MDVVVARRFGVGANGQPERFALDPVGAQHLGDLADGTGCDDREAGVDLARIGPNAGFDAEHFVAIHDRDCFGLVDHLGASGGSSIHERSVEPTSRPDRSVIRESFGGRPVEFAHSLTGDHPQAFDVVSVVERDLEFVERTDRARRQTIAADFVAAVFCLFEDDHAEACTRRSNRRCCAGRAATNDCDVVLLSVHPSTVPQIA